MSAQLRVVNLVATAFMDCTVDLIKCAEAMGGKCGSNELPSCVIRSAKPRVTAMIMANGKLLFCGARKPEDIMQVAWALLLKLYRKNLIAEPGVTLMNLHVENIVCSYSLGFEINVELFYNDHADTSVYQPQIISPCQFYPDGSGRVIVIYGTGECIVTGSRTFEEAIATSKLVDWRKYQLGHEYRPFESTRSVKKQKQKQSKGDKE